nr:hypothetical protein [uncultured Porphyromonas sp.]
MALGKKTGGRKAGTPNKTTAITKEAISKIIDEYNSSGLMQSDLMGLDPRDRLEITVKLMSYVLPKVQSVALDVSGNISTKTIEDELTELAGMSDE